MKGHTREARAKILVLLRCTPAMAAGVSATLWELDDMVKVLED